MFFPAEVNRLKADMAAAFCAGEGANATLYWYTGGVSDGVSPDLIGETEVTGSSRVMIEVIRSADIARRNWGNVEAGSAVFWFPTDTVLEGRRGLQVEVNGERWVLDFDPPGDVKAHMLSGLPLGVQMMQAVYGKRRKDHN